MCDIGSSNVSIESANSFTAKISMYQEHIDNMWTLLLESRWWQPPYIYIMACLTGSFVLSQVKRSATSSRFESNGSISSNSAQKCVLHLFEHAQWTCMDFVWLPALTDMRYYVIICDMCGILREPIICHPQKSCPCTVASGKWREVQLHRWALLLYVVSRVVQMPRMTHRDEGIKSSWFQSLLRYSRRASEKLSLFQVLQVTWDSVSIVQVYSMQVWFPCFHNTWTTHPACCDVSSTKSQVVFVPQ